MSAGPEIRLATTDAERRAAYALRYRIYVEEMGRYRDVADHGKRLLVEPVDARSRVYCCFEGEEVVGTMRHTWGGDAPLADRHVAQYGLGPFLDAGVAPEDIVVGERFMVERRLRGTDLLFRMFCAYLAFCNEHRVQLVFGDCEPHLLNVYLALGFRPYSKRHVAASETGFLVPLLLIPEDVGYMRDIGSPLAAVLTDFGAGARVPGYVYRILAEGGAVLTQRFGGREYWSAVHAALDGFEADRPHMFDGLDEPEIQACLDKSTLIECRAGDRVIKKGNVARNLYVVLAGELAVRDAEGVVDTLHPGDVFGEIAFLTGLPRTMDVTAEVDGTRVVSLSERTVRALIDASPNAAAKLLLNVSKMLCLRLAKRA